MENIFGKQFITSQMQLNRLLDKLSEGFLKEVQENLEVKEKFEKTLEMGDIFSSDFFSYALNLSLKDFSYLLNLLIDEYKKDSSDKVYQLISQLIVDRADIIKRVVNSVVYATRQTKNEDLKEKVADYFRDIVLNIEDKGLGLKREAKGKELLRYMIEKFDTSKEGSFVTFLISQNSPIYKRIERQNWSDLINRSSFDSGSKNKLSSDDEYEGYGETEGDDIFSDMPEVDFSMDKEQKRIKQERGFIFWEKMKEYIYELLKNESTKTFGGMTNDQLALLYKKYLDNGGSPRKSLRTTKDFKDVGMESFLKKDLFFNIAKEVYEKYGEKELIELVKNLNFKKQADKATALRSFYVVGGKNGIEHLNLPEINYVLDVLTNKVDVDVENLSSYYKKKNKDPFTRVKDVFVQFMKGTKTYFGFLGKISFSDFYDWLKQNNFLEGNESQNYVATSMGFNSAKDANFTSAANFLLGSSKPSSINEEDEVETTEETGGFDEKKLYQYISIYGNIVG